MKHLPQFWILTLSFGAVALFSFASGFADEGDEDRKDFFEKKIRPVLVKNCYACHSQKADELKG